MGAAADGEPVAALQKARSEALRKAEQALNELKELGLTYSLVEEPAPKVTATAKRALEQAPQDEDEQPKPSFDQTLYGS